MLRFFVQRVQLVLAHGLLKNISYSTGNKEINDKYALNSESLSFALSLNLVKTNLSLEENSKTIVDVQYFGEEESLFGTRELFDILKRDLKSATATLEKSVQTPKLKEIAIKAAETYAKARGAEGIHGKKFLGELDAALSESEKSQQRYVDSLAAIGREQIEESLGVEQTIKMMNERRKTKENFPKH